MAKIEKRKPVIPSLTAVKNAIQNLSEKNWDQFKYNNNIDEYFKELDQYFLSEIGLLPYAMLYVPSESMASRCFRARKFDPSINTKLISDFSYPPASICNKIMRANLPNNPVFYASPDIKTALIETMSATFEEGKGNGYFISEWSFRPGYKFTVVPFVYDNVSEQNIFRNLIPGIFQNMENQFTELNKDELESMQEVLKLLSRLFVEDNYVASSYIAHSHLYAPHNLRGDVFIYPSIQTDLHMINFAIHPNTVAHKMVLNKVYYLTASEFTYLKTSSTVNFNFSFRQYAINENGVLMWNDFNDETAEEFKKMFSGDE